MSYFKEDVWDYLAVYDRGDGREALVPNYFNEHDAVPGDFKYMTMSMFRSPFALLKNRLGINFFDESFDEDINTIVKQSLAFSIDIGANPIIESNINGTPKLLGYESVTNPFEEAEEKFLTDGIDPKKDLKFFNNYYSWYEIFKSPMSTVSKNYLMDLLTAYVWYSELLIASWSDTDALERLKQIKFEPPAETQLNAVDYCRTLEDLLVLMDELCYVNAKIYFDSPDSGYVTNQFAQRKGELQWRIQSLLEDRMNIGYGPVEPSVIP